MGNFAGFAWNGLSLSNGKIAFSAQAAGGQQGIYTTPDGLVANTNDPPIPGFPPFADLRFPDVAPALHGSGAAYIADQDSENDSLEIYARYGQVQTQVFSCLNNLTLIKDCFELSPEAMDGNRIVFLTKSDNSIKYLIYLAELNIPGDADFDGDVDGLDFSRFTFCFNKAGNPTRTLGCSPEQADIFDTDEDNDVDGLDFARFATCFNGAGKRPRCVD